MSRAVTRTDVCLKKVMLATVLRISRRSKGRGMMIHEEARQRSRQERVAAQTWEVVVEVKDLQDSLTWGGRGREQSKTVPRVWA